MEFRNSTPEEQAWDRWRSKALLSDSASLQAKFVELDELLEDKGWMEQYATSDDEETLVSDIDRRDESHLQMLQKELEAAEGNLVGREPIHDAVAVSQEGNDRRNDMLETHEWFKPDNRIGEDYMMDREFETPEEHHDCDDCGRDDRSNFYQGRSVQLAQDVKEIECDLNGPIFPLEYVSETSSIEEDNYYNPNEANIGAANSSQVVHFSSSQCPSDESQSFEFGESSTESSTQFQYENARIFQSRALNQLTSDSYEDTAEHSFVGLGEASIPWGQCERTHADVFADPFFMDGCTGNHIFAQTKPDGIEEDNIGVNSYTLQEDAGWRNYLPNWKSRMVVGSLFCVLLILVHVSLFKAFLFLLLSNHSMDSIETTTPSLLCKAPSGCMDAFPIVLGESGEKQVVGNTMGSLSATTPPCAFVPQSPAVWYSLIGNGRKLSASVSSDNLSAIVTVFQGGCDGLEGIHGPSECCGTPHQPNSLTWDTLEGRPYSIAVHDAANSTGSFNLHIWDSRYTTMLLSQHSDRQNKNEIPAWAMGWSLAIVSLLAIFSVFS